LDHCRIQFPSVDHFSDGTTTIYRHSGIGLVTPADRHYGLAENVVEERRRVLRAAFEAHPRAICERRSVTACFAKGGMDQPTGEYFRWAKNNLQ